LPFACSFLVLVCHEIESQIHNSLIYNQLQKLQTTSTFAQASNSRGSASGAWWQYMKLSLNNFLATIFALTTAPAVATTFTIQPQTEAESKDTKIYVSFSTSNFSSNLNVVSADITDFRSLIQFDTSSLAVLGVDEISSAVVRLYSTGLNTTGLSTATSVSITLSPILNPWKENAGDAGSAPLATWDAFFGPAPTLTFGGVASTQTVTGVGYFDLDVTALVKSWVGGTGVNHGLLIEALGPMGDVGIADTDTPAFAPALLVTTVPEPSSLLALGAATLFILRRRRN
jgi:hypothetical protein